MKHYLVVIICCFVFTIATAKADIPSYTASRDFVETHCTNCSILEGKRIYLLLLDGGQPDSKAVNIIAHSGQMNLMDMTKYITVKNPMYVLIMRSNGYSHFLKSKSELETFKIYPGDVVQFYDGPPFL